MSKSHELTISFDRTTQFARLQAERGLTTDEYVSAASLSLKAALTTAEACGCDGCSDAMPRLRLALTLVGSGASTVAPVLSTPVAGSC